MRDHDEYIPREWHERDMQLINDRWAAQHFKECRVRNVIQRDKKGNRYLQITDVVWSPEGLVVYVD